MKFNTGSVNHLETEFRLDPALYETLRAEAFAGLKALPKRGLEIGGILTQAGAENASVMDGFELLPCDHLYGPGYQLSPADIERFQARCREIETTNEVHIACFFRSCTRDEFEVTPDDLYIVSELVSDRAGIVLIKPFPTGSAIFRFFRPAGENKWDRFREFEVLSPVTSSNGASSSLGAAHPETSKREERTPAERQLKKENESAPGRSASELVLSPELTEEIRRNSFDALPVPNGRGAELGGLLTAAASNPSPGASLRLVTREYPPDSSYPDSGGIPELRETARECESNGETVVAYFRSSSRFARQVGSVDEETIAQAFPHVRCVVMATPLLDGSARIRVFNRDIHGRWNCGTELEAWPPRLSKSVSLASVPSVPLASEETVQRSAIPRKSLGWVAACAVALLIGTSAITVYWLTRQRVRSPGPPPPNAVVAAPSGAKPNDESVGLNAREENGMLHVTWDRDSAAARSALFGVMEIDDSDTSKVIPILKADATEGSIVYAPHSSDVKFHLKLVDADGKQSAEVIRVLVDDLPKRRNEAGGDLQAAPPPTISVLKQAPAQPEKQVADAAHPQNQRQNQRQFRPPPVPVRLQGQTKSDVNIQPPPELIAAAPPSQVGFPLEVPPVPKPAAKDNGASAPLSPATSSQRAARPVPALPSPQAATPPEPLTKVSPVMTEAVRAIVQNQDPMTVNVIVSVGTDGQVLDARVDPQSSVKNPFLSASALNAARRWRFKPATRDGHSLPSEYRIEFVFRRS
jgi:periplasmic protein TonB